MHVSVAGCLVPECDTVPFKPDHICDVTSNRVCEATCTLYMSAIFQG